MTRHAKAAAAMGDSAAMGAIGSLLAGAAIWGLAGYGVDQLLGTRFVVAIGVLVGMALGVYAVVRRLDGLASARPDSISSTSVAQRDDTRRTLSGGERQ